MLKDIKVKLKKKNHRRKERNISMHMLACLVINFEQTDFLLFNVWQHQKGDYTWTIHILVLRCTPVHVGHTLLKVLPIHDSFTSIFIVFSGYQRCVCVRERESIWRRKRFHPRKEEYTQQYKEKQNQLTRPNKWGINSPWKILLINSSHLQQWGPNPQ